VCLQLTTISSLDQSLRRKAIRSRAPPELLQRSLVAPRPLPTIELFLCEHHDDLILPPDFYETVSIDGSIHGPLFRRTGSRARSRRRRDDVAKRRATYPAILRMRCPAMLASGCLSAQQPETGAQTPLPRDRPPYPRFPGERVRDTSCEACESRL